LILADISAEMLGALGAFSGFSDFLLDVDGRLETEGLREEVEDFGRGGGDRDVFFDFLVEVLLLLLSLLVPLLDLLFVLLFDRLLVPLLDLLLVGLRLFLRELLVPLLDLLLVLLLLLLVPLLLLFLFCARLSSILPLQEFEALHF